MNRKITNWLQYPKNGYVLSNIKPKEMGYYSRIHFQHTWRKRNCSDQLSQRGHGKIPLERIQLRDKLTRERFKQITDTLRTQLGYGKG